MSLYHPGINRQCNLPTDKLEVCLGQIVSFNRFFENSRCIEISNLGYSENSPEYLDNNFCTAQHYLRARATFLGVLPYITNESNMPENFRPMHAYERDFTNLKLDKISNRDKKKLSAQIRIDFNKWAESQVIGARAILSNKVYGVSRRGLWFR